MNNTLLIHVGMMKTGTTALQKYLFDNGQMLESHGWSYPILDNNIQDVDNFYDIQERGGNGHFLYGDKQIVDTESENWNKGWEIILRHLKYKNVIVSSELIMIEEPDRFLRCALEKYNNIKVIIYLRRQDRWIESCYNESVKTNCTFKEIQDYTDLEEKLHYLSQLDMMSKIIGRKNLIVRIYEKQQLIDNDIVSDFLSVIGMSLEDNSPKRKLINPSIQGNYFEIKRLINSAHNAEKLFGDGNNIFNWDMDVEFANVCWKLSQSNHQEKEEYGFFTPEERKEFLEKYALENEQIARGYLHRENGVLFYDNRMDYPMYEAGQSSGFEADIIRVFSAMLYQQNWKFQKMLNKIQQDILATILMKDISEKLHNRKLLFFGAGSKCREMLRILMNVSVSLIADNDKQKDGTVLNALPIRYAKNITEWQEYFVVVTCDQFLEIEKQLCDLGLEKGKDYILVQEYGL